MSIFTIPFILNLVLQFGDTPLSLPVTKMLSGLVLTVLVPTILGQILRPWAKKVLAPYVKVFSVFNQCLVLMIILSAVSSSTDRILQTGAGFFGIFLFMLILHLLIPGMNLGISKIIGLDIPATAAFTIHVSQKTLTISYVVSSGFFALAYPMALIPSIAYHIAQMVADIFVAQWFRQKISGA